MTNYPAFKKIYTTILFFALTLLYGCQRYSFAINENVVYDPPPLFKAYAIEDQALRTCVKGEIEEQSIRKPTDLIKLACPQGEIRNLTGLEIFSELEQLGLADNQLTDAGILQKLKNLKQIDLRGNQIISFNFLQSLHKLEQLYIKGNAAADCSTLPGNSKHLRIQRPEHCTQ